MRLVRRIAIIIPVLLAAISCVGQNKDHPKDCIKLNNEGIEYLTNQPVVGVITAPQPTRVCSVSSALHSPPKKASQGTLRAPTYLSSINIDWCSGI